MKRNRRWRARARLINPYAVAPEPRTPRDAGTSAAVVLAGAAGLVVLGAGSASAQEWEDEDVTFGLSGSGDLFADATGDDDRPAGSDVFDGGDLSDVSLGIDTGVVLPEIDPDAFGPPARSSSREAQAERPDAVPGREGRGEEDEGRQPRGAAAETRPEQPIRPRAERPGQQQEEPAPATRRQWAQQDPEPPTRDRSTGDARGALTAWSPTAGDLARFDRIDEAVSTGRIGRTDRETTAGLDAALGLTPPRGAGRGTGGPRLASGGEVEPEARGRAGSADRAGSGAMNRYPAGGEVEPAAGSDGGAPGTGAPARSRNRTAAAAVTDVATVSPAVRGRGDAATTDARGTSRERGRADASAVSTPAGRGWTVADEVVLPGLEPADEVLTGFDEIDEAVGRGRIGVTGAGTTAGLDADLGRPRGEEPVPPLGLPRTGVSDDRATGEGRRGGQADPPGRSAPLDGEPAPTGGTRPRARPQERTAGADTGTPGDGRLGAVRPGSPNGGEERLAARTDRATPGVLLTDVPLGPVPSDEGTAEDADGALPRSAGRASEIADERELLSPGRALEIADEVVLDPEPDVVDGTAAVRLDRALASGEIDVTDPGTTDGLDTALQWAPPGWEDGTAVPRSVVPGRTGRPGGGSGDVAGTRNRGPLRLAEDVTLTPLTAEVIDLPLSGSTPGATGASGAGEAEPSPGSPDGPAFADGVRLSPYGFGVPERPSSGAPAGDDQIVDRIIRTGDEGEPVPPSRRPADASGPRTVTSSDVRVADTGAATSEGGTDRPTDVLDVLGGTVTGLGNAALSPMVDRYRSPEEEFFDDPTRAERAQESFRTAAEAAQRLLPGDERASESTTPDDGDREQDAGNPWRITTFDEENWPPEVSVTPRSLAFASLGILPTVTLTAAERSGLNGTSLVQELIPSTSTLPRSFVSDLLLGEFPLEFVEGDRENAVVSSVASGLFAAAADTVSRQVQNRLPEIQQENNRYWMNRNNTSGRPIPVARPRPMQLSSPFSAGTIFSIAPTATLTNIVADEVTRRADLDPQPTDENNNRYYLEAATDAIATGIGVGGPISVAGAIQSGTSLPSAAKKAWLAYALPAAQSMVATILTEEPPDTSDPIYRTTRAGIQFAQDAAGAVGHTVLGEPREEDGNAVNTLQALGNGGRAIVTPVASALTRAFPNVVSDADETLDYLLTGDPVERAPIVSDEAMETARESRQRAQTAWQLAREQEPETRWGAGGQLLSNAVYLVGQSALGSVQGLASPVTDLFRTDTDEFLEVPTQRELAGDRFAEARQAWQQAGSAVDLLRNGSPAADGSTEDEPIVDGPLPGSLPSVGGLQLGGTTDGSSPGLGEFEFDSPFGDLLPLGGGNGVTTDGAPPSAALDWLGSTASPAFSWLGSDDDPSRVVITPDGQAQIERGRRTADGIEWENRVVGDEPGDDGVIRIFGSADGGTGEPDPRPGGTGFTPMYDVDGDPAQRMVVDVEPLDGGLGLAATRFRVHLINGDRGVYDASGELLEVEVGNPPPTVPRARR